MADFFKKIADINEPYLIAEIGINHNGDMNIAKKLIDASNACEWNCVKFQKRDPNLCVPEDQKQVPRETPWGMMAYIDYKHKIEFQQKEYEIIDTYCKEKPIDWTASVWDLNSLEFMMNFDVPFIKIPSAQLTNHELVSELAKSNKPIIISTGMSTWDMIDSVVEILENNIKVLHISSEPIFECYNQIFWPSIKTTQISKYIFAYKIIKKNSSLRFGAKKNQLKKYC